MQDWERFGEEIRRTVQDAVDSQDYRKLNQTITDTINRAVNGAVNGAEQGMRSFGNAFDQATRNMGRGPGGPRGRYGQMGGADRWGRTPGGGVPPFGTYRWSGTDGNGRAWNPDMQDYKAESQGSSRYGYSNAQQSPVLYGSTTGTKAGGIVMIATGGSIALIFLILFLASCIASLPESPGALWIMRAVFGLFTAASGMITGWGIKLLKQVGRFKNYSRRIAGREYCNISEIGSNSGKSIKFVTKDLERMISKGWFRQGHMDGEKKCLILSNRAYEEYLQIETRRQQSKAEEPVKKEEKTQENTKEKEAKNEKLAPEVQKIIDQGDAFIRKIHECNEAIPGEEISAKISRMEMLVDRIFDRVEENPQSVSDIRKLMEYYLPTTIKLLEAYEQLDRQPVDGENIQTAKREIEATLDTLNTAFEKLLDDLFQDTMWDVSSDISVLNTMLAQENTKEKEAKNEKLAPEVQKIIDQGDAFIRKIHECNEAIPGEEISAKISRMEMLVDRIFDRVEENPQSVSDIRKLMEYYLPTTIKLLEAYEQLDRQPVDGENIQTAKREIEATLDTLNTAFEKLLDDLFQDTMWDVSSDISVLNTMLAQEGLKEDGMKK